MQENEDTLHQKLKIQTEILIKAWFKQADSDFFSLLADVVMIPGRREIDKKALIAQITKYFKQFAKFVNGRFDIIETEVKFLDENKAFGIAEGALGFRAILPNAHAQIISGPFKLYFVWQHNNWKMVNLDFPGFKF